MKFKDIEFNTYFKNYPDANGHFGKYGGSYIPPELQIAMNEISEAYQTICKSRKFNEDILKKVFGIGCNLYSQPKVTSDIICSYF